jgi:hypothetical protein
MRAPFSDVSVQPVAQHAPTPCAPVGDLLTSLARTPLAALTPFRGVFTVQAE